MMNRKPTSPGASIWHILVLTMGAMLIVMLIIDIYIRILSPETLHSTMTIPKVPLGNSSSHEYDVQNSEENSTGHVFHDMEAIEDMGDAGDKAWDTLLFPPKGGYLFVKTNDSVAREEPWGVSMFHAMHCLFMLRTYIQGHQDGSTTEEQQQQHKGHQYSNRHFHIKVSAPHFKHCISYLAQSIMCAADGTLEVPYKHYDKDGNFVDYIIDGIGIWHQCKDKSILWKTVMDSEKEPFDRWNYTVGDTIHNLWG